jgi:hypothetical protein
MRVNDVVQIYLKEREYEKAVFGDYESLPELSFPSFLIFLKQYIDKALEAYTGKWDTELPPWLRGCKEMGDSEGTEFGSAPVKAYEEVIKIMALSGAALETYTNLDASKWRKNPEEDAQKWRRD